MTDQQDGRYTRLDKNLCHGILAVAAKKYGLTGRDYFLLFKPLGEAQRQKSRTLRFTSGYDFLHFLRWPPEGKSYNTLYRSLTRWERVRLDFPAYYKPGKRKWPKRPKLDVNDPTSCAAYAEWEEDEAHRLRSEATLDPAFRVRRKRKPGSRTEMSFSRVLEIEDEDNDFHITFPLKFYKAHSIDMGYNVAVFPSKIQALRYPATIHLFLLLSAFDKNIKMNMHHLLTKIGLAEENQAASRRKILRMVKRIEAVEGVNYHVSFSPSETITIVDAVIEEQAEIQARDNAAQERRRYWAMARNC